MSHSNDKAPLSQPLTVEIGDANNGRTESNNNLFPNGNICGNNNDDDSESLGPLPPKWERAYTESGEVYFIDHGTGTSHWLDPRLSKFQKKSLEDCLDDELPYGWEKISDPHYGTYFIDHVNRRTQYENPVLQAKRAQTGTHAQQCQQPGPSPGSAASTTVTNTSNNANTFTRNPAELCGQRIRTALVKSSRGLGFTIVGGDDRDGADEFLQIKSVVPKGPAWLDGRLRMGDVIVRVNDVCVLGYTHSRIVRLFQSIPAGSTVALEICRGYPLPFDPNDPNTEVVTTIAVDSQLTISSPKERGRLGGRPSPIATATAALVDTNYNLLAHLYGGNIGGGSTAQLGDLDDKDMAPSAITPTPQVIPGIDDDAIVASLQQLAQMSLTSASHSPLSPTSPTSPTSTASLQNTNVNSAQPIQEVRVAIVKGNLGFGFTIADSACGQRVKKILDRQRCKDLQEGDVLLGINDCSLLRMAHDDVVQVLKNCAYNSEATICVQRGGSTNGANISKSAVNTFVGRGGNKAMGVRKAQLPLIVGGNSMFRSKTPTADIYSTQTREVLPSRPKTPIIDTRHIHSTSTKSPPAQSDCNGGARSNVSSLYADRAQLRLSLIDAGDGQIDCDGIDVDGDAEGLGVDVDVDVDLDVDDVDNGDPDMDLRHQLHHMQQHIHMQQQQQQQQQQQLPPDHHSARHKYHRYDCQCYVCYGGGEDRRINGGSNGSNGSTNGGGLYDVLPSPSSVNGHLLKMNNGPWWPNTGPAAPNSHPPTTYHDMSVVLHRQERGFGFRIVGGIEDRSQVAVGHIVPGGSADLDGRLRTGDELLSVDGCSVVKASHRQVVRLMSSATARGQVSLILRRRQSVLHQPPQFNQPPNPTTYDVTVTRSEHEGFGFVIISSVNKIGSTIGRLIEDSPAERCGHLRVGDYIVAVNRIDITHLSHGDIVNLIKESGLTVTLTIAPTTD